MLSCVSPRTRQRSGFSSAGPAPAQAAGLGISCLEAACAAAAEGPCRPVRYVPLLPALQTFPTFTKKETLLDSYDYVMYGKVRSPGCGLAAVRVVAVGLAPGCVNLVLAAGPLWSLEPDDAQAHGRFTGNAADLGSAALCTWRMQFHHASHARSRQVATLHQWC